MNGVLLTAKKAVPFGNYRGKSRATNIWVSNGVEGLSQS